MISGLNFKRNGRLPLVYLCSNLLRKLFLAGILVFNRDKPVFNIFAVNFLTLFMIIVTGYTNPMISSF